MESRRGISPVIATIILSAVVLTIGSAVWSYAQGASTVIATGYVSDTLTIMREVTERFTIEHVSTSPDGQTLKVWVYNYGEPDIDVDVYATLAVTAEALATGNGATTHFTGTLAQKPIKPTTVTIKVAGATALTDSAGQGALTGATGSGSINYVTGTYDITFTTIPTVGQAITADYTIDYTFRSPVSITVSSGSSTQIDVAFQSNPLQKGDQVAIKVHSGRQNNAYYNYYV